MPVTSRIADTAGAPTTPALDQGRWKHGDMAARYTLGKVAAEALH